MSEEYDRYGCVGLCMCVCTHGYVCACIWQLVMAKDSALNFNKCREIRN